MGPNVTSVGRGGEMDSEEVGQEKWRGGKKNKGKSSREGAKQPS